MSQCPLSASSVRKELCRHVGHDICAYDGPITMYHSRSRVRREYVEQQSRLRSGSAPPGIATAVSAEHWECVLHFHELGRGGVLLAVGYGGGQGAGSWGVTRASSACTVTNACGDYIEIKVISNPEGNRVGRLESSDPMRFVEFGLRWLETPYGLGHTCQDFVRQAAKVLAMDVAALTQFQEAGIAVFLLSLAASLLAIAIR